MRSTTHVHLIEIRALKQIKGGRDANPEVAKHADSETVSFPGSFDKSVLRTRLLGALSKGK